MSVGQSALSVSGIAVHLVRGSASRRSSRRFTCRRSPDSAISIRATAWTVRFRSTASPYRGLRSPRCTRLPARSTATPRPDAAQRADPEATCGDLRYAAVGRQAHRTSKANATRQKARSAWRVPWRVTSTASNRALRGYRTAHGHEADLERRICGDTAPAGEFVPSPGRGTSSLTSPDLDFRLRRAIR
jgi:hypothetical protein